MERRLGAEEYMVVILPNIGASEAQLPLDFLVCGSFNRFLYHNGSDILNIFLRMEFEIFNNLSKTLYICNRHGEKWKQGLLITIAMGQFSDRRNESATRDVMLKRFSNTFI